MTAGVDVTGLAIPMTKGNYYHFKFITSYATSATTCGIGFKFGTSPDMIGLNWKAHIGFGMTGGTAGDCMDYSVATAGTSIIGSTRAIAANTPYMVVLEGSCQPGTSGTLQLQAVTRVAGVQIKVLGTSGVGFAITC